MRILHYTLGFPPYRSGGLVNYAIGIMEEQALLGHEVFVLYPGILDITRRTKIIENNKDRHIYKVFELRNSLPLAIFKGIKNPDEFMKQVDKQIYTDFLKKINPEIIHIHTIMGIHQEFFLAAKELNIKLLFTTHDYFGLSPEPNFYLNGTSFDKNNTIDNWIEVSKGALPTWKLRILQTNMYPLIRYLGKKIKKKKNVFLKKTIKLEKKEKNKTLDLSRISQRDRYVCLKSYYEKIFSLIDFFHYNSNLSKEVYEYNIPSIRGQVIPITLKYLDEIKPKTKSKAKKVRIAYIGPDKEFKGFDDFKKISNLMAQDEYEFHTYGYDVQETISNIIQHGRYTPYELSNIYAEIDILLVMSKWKETFGLTVIESINLDTPVFVSECVGAKDLITKEYQYKDIENLIKKIKYLKSYDKMKNSKITFPEHYMSILDLYSRVIFK